MFDLVGPPVVRLCLSAKQPPAGLNVTRLHLMKREYGANPTEISDSRNQNVRH